MRQDTSGNELARLSPSAVSLRESWDVLPDSVLTAMHDHTGRVIDVTPAETGYSSHVAATVRTENGTVFVKGMRSSHPLAWTQQREAIVNPHVVPISPKLLWRVTTAGWDVLGFEHVRGRIADYGRTSSDLDLVVGTMDAVCRPAPDIGLTTAEARWHEHLAHPSDAALLHGDTLLHTDWHHTNLLVTCANAIYVIDWAVTTRGAAWIDPACWVVWLIYAGHTPGEAQRWAAKVGVWSTAPDRSLDVFATVLADHWRHVATHHPNTMTYRLRDAAAQWASHRTHPAR